MFADFAAQAAVADDEPSEVRNPRGYTFPRPKPEPPTAKEKRQARAQALKPVEPVHVSCVVSPLGALIGEADLKRLLGPQGLRKLRGRLTTERQEYVGKRAVARHVRRYYRECRVPVDGSEQPFYAFARWGEFAAALLELNPAVRLDYRCSIPRGKVVAWELTAADAEPLFPNQQLILGHLLERVYTEEQRALGLAGCILVADTGFGKTFTALALARRLGRKTLVVMPNTNNFSEWERVLAARYAVSLGYYYADAKRDGDVVLTTIQSITSALIHNRGFLMDDGTVLPEGEYYRSFGLVIYDEVHNYATESRQEIFWRLLTRNVLGLTATPDERSDRLDEVYHYHVGPEVVAASLPGYSREEIAWNGLVRVLRYHGPPEFTVHIQGHLGVDTLAMNRQCARDPWRLALLLYYIERMAGKGRNVFVFAEHRGFLDNLHRLMKDRLAHSYPERQITQLTGGLKREQAAEGRQGDIILITYGYGAESLSLPRMDTIIFASPRKAKCRQIVGRILRRGGDPSVRRLIYDMVDVLTPMAKQYSKRKQVYVEKGFELQPVELHYHEYDNLVREYGTNDGSVEFAEDLEDAFLEVTDPPSA